MALLPPATQSSSLWSFLPHVSQSQQGPHSPSPFTAPLFFPVFFHPSPSICRSLSRLSFLYFTARSAVSPITTSSLSPFPFLSFSLTHSLSLLCFIIHCFSSPPRVPPCTKNLPPCSRCDVVTYLFMASQLMCELVSLNCLWIYNLAWRECVWASSAEKICILCLWLNQIWLRLRGVADPLQFMQACIVAYGFRRCLVAFVTMTECEQMQIFMTRIHSNH